MLGTVYIRDINFAFQNSQSNANIFGSHDMGVLRPRWKAKLKPREIVTLPLQEGPAENIRSNILLNIR